MADIQTDLNTIAKGKYGKDVRKAIHDAIETCYSDGKVGSVDLTARKQIAQLVTSGNKELTEQTLWSGSIYGTGASLTLSSAIGNFDYLDIYVTKEGNTSIHTIPAVRSTYNIRENNLPDDGAAAFSISEAGINFPDTTTLAIYKQSYFARSSSGVDTGRIVNPTDTDSQSNLHIIKVIGRKSVANTEVTDIRNPADGMTEPTGGYSTAGDAVRGQILELKSEITQLEAIPYAVKRAMDTLFQNVVFKNTDVYSDELATFHAWATAINVVSISAVFNQGQNVIYETDSLDSLKQYLTVTASYDDGTSSVISDYTLSGALSEASSTITVTYDGKTTTFIVAVTISSWLYDASKGELLSAQDYVTVTSDGTHTETIVNNELVLHADLSSYCTYNLQNPTGNALIRAEINPVLAPLNSSKAVSGFRFQLTDDNASGAQAYIQCDENNKIVVMTFLGSTRKNYPTNFSLNENHLIEFELGTSTQTMRIDGSQIYSHERSTMYMTGSKINSHAGASAANPNGVTTKVKWIALYEVS